MIINRVVIELSNGRDQTFNLKTEKEARLIAEILNAIFPSDRIVQAKIESRDENFNDWFCNTNLFEV